MSARSSTKLAMSSRSPYPDLLPTSPKCWQVHRVKASGFPLIQSPVIWLLPWLFPHIPELRSTKRRSILGLVLRDVAVFQAITSKITLPDQKQVEFSIIGGLCFDTPEYQVLPRYSVCLSN